LAKPLGYGCAKITITESLIEPNDASKPALTLDEAKAQFESWMQFSCPDWLTGPEIQKDLIGMASHNHGKDDALRYPILAMRGPNEFATAKGSSRDNLPSYALRQWRDIPAEPSAPQQTRTQPSSGRSIPARATPPKSVDPQIAPASPPPPKPEKPIVTIEITGSKRNKNAKVVWKAKMNPGIDSENGSVCAPLPPDIEAGKIYRAILEGNDANNHQFRCIEGPKAAE